ncbi:MAG: hypothetical protein DRQ55_12855 [Planctomycetota bacterium]|nr:MAG: hypothetical protein DRQ55_12855 [Planctomycetota bacterium]
MVCVVAFGSLGCSTTECVVDNPNRGNPLALGPSIEEISVEQATHGSAVKVVAELRAPPGGGMVDDSVAVHVRSTRQQEIVFGPTLAMHETESLIYERGLYKLNYGPYEACVMADFKPAPAAHLPPPVITTYTDKLQFFVGPSAACEQWSDEESGTAGWTFGDIFDVGDGDPVPPGGYAPVFARTDEGLTVLTGPLYTSGDSASLWRFDFISPDLSDQAGWQNLYEVALRISSDTDVIVKFQPQFTYLYDDGSLVTFAPVDDDGEWIFYELNGTDTFYIPTMRPGAVTLTQMRVRIFGAYYITSPEFFVHLKMLCPMPSRLPSLLRVVLGELATSEGKSGKSQPAPRRP